MAELLLRGLHLARFGNQLHRVASVTTLEDLLEDASNDIADLTCSPKAMSRLGVSMADVVGWGARP